MAISATKIEWSKEDEVFKTYLDLCSAFYGLFE